MVNETKKKRGRPPVSKFSAADDMARESVAIAEPNEPIAKPEMAEVATAANTSVFGVLKGFPIDNPNDFFEHEGGRTLNGEAEYMVSTDPYLFGLMQTRKLAIVGLERQITGPEGEITDFVRRAFAKIRNFTAFLYQTLSALDVGFSIGEILWRFNRDEGRIEIADIKPRDQDFFFYGYGANGEPILNLVTKDKPAGTPVPARKFLEFNFQERFGNKYGSALFQRIFWYWYYKRHATEFWAVFTEKYATPPMKASATGKVSAADKAAVLNFMKGSKNASGIILPEGLSLELIEAQKQGVVASYQDFLNFLNRGMSIAILGQTLTTDIQGQGSYSLGQIHELVRQDILRADILAVENLVNDSLIRWLVDYNFDQVDEYPKWSIVLDEKVDPVQMSQVVVNLTNAGFDQIPIAWIQKTFGIPAPADAQGKPEATLTRPVASTFSELLRNTEIATYNAAVKKF